MKNKLFVPDSAQSLFSIPRNKRFVYINADVEMEKDPLTDSIDMLLQFLESTSNKDHRNGSSDASDAKNLDDIRPFKVKTIIS